MIRLSMADLGCVTWKWVSFTVMIFDEIKFVNKEGLHCRCGMKVLNYSGVNGDG